MLVNESPDSIYFNSDYLSWTDNDAVAFGFVKIDNKTYCIIGSAHPYFLEEPQNTDIVDLLNKTYGREAKKILNDFYHNGRKMYYYPGRLWYDRGIISFWSLPQKNDLIKILKMIQDKMLEKIGQSVDLTNFNIELPNGSNSNPELGSWNDRFEKGQNFISVSQYVNGSKTFNNVWDDETMNKMHSDPKLRNQKRERILNDKNFKGGSRAMHAKHPNAKPEEIMAWKQAHNIDETINDEIIKYLQEDPDSIRSNNVKIGDFLSSDAIAFGFLEINNELAPVIAKSTTHGGMRNNEQNYYTIDAYARQHNIKFNDICLRNFYSYPGRLWTSQKVISFWDMPSLSNINEILNKIKTEVYRQFNIDINWNEYFIDVFHNDHDDNLVPILKYIKTSYTPANHDMSVQHVDPKQRNQKRERILNDKNFKGGSRKNQAKYPNAKPQEIMAWKQAHNIDETTNQNIIKNLQENPDTVYRNGVKVGNFNSIDGIAFGFLPIPDESGKNSQLYCVVAPGTIHGDMKYLRCNDIEILKYTESKNIPKTKISNDFYLFKGRLWTNANAISFYSLPSPSEMPSILDKIKEKVKSATNIDIDWNQYLLDLPLEDGDVYTNPKYIPILSYNNANITNSEHPAVLHIDPKLRNQKRERILNDKNFKGGSRRNQAKYPNAKPEEIMAWKQAHNIDETINQEIDAFLNEGGFDASKEIEILTGKIMDGIKYNIINNHYASMITNDFINPNDFNTLKEFLDDTYITVIFRNVNKSDPNMKGEYTDKGFVKYINLYLIEDDLIRRFNNAVQSNDMKTIDVFLDNYNNTLFHELQHAYDDYRTNGKFHKNKQGQKYFADLKKFNDGESNRKPSQLYNQYLKLDHEVWARFTSFINANKPFKFVNGKKEIIPMRDFINNLSNMQGFNQIKPSQRKKLQRYAAQFWYKFTEQT